MTSRESLMFIIIITIESATPATYPFQPKLSSVVDWTNYNHHEPSGPGTYAFGYDIEDPATNNIQFRNEERHPNGTVTGSYGYIDPDGTVRIVHYEADNKGYRAKQENDLKLSMLKPIIFSDTPIFTPEMASALRYREGYWLQNVYDQRTRPFDQFNKREGTIYSTNLLRKPRINSAPEPYQPGSIYFP